MQSLNSTLALLVGLAIRLVIPIAITVIAVHFLRRLDERWETEARELPPVVQKPKCWEVRGCPPEPRAACLAFKSDLPCWQVFRLPNGYLREQCLICTVFVRAPVYPLSHQTI
jgi:hypothetical protein